MCSSKKFCAVLKDKLCSGEICIKHNSHSLIKKVLAALPYIKIINGELFAKVGKIASEPGVIVLLDFAK